MPVADCDGISHFISSKLFFLLDGMNMDFRLIAGVASAFLGGMPCMAVACSSVTDVFTPAIEVNLTDRAADSMAMGVELTGWQIGSQSNFFSGMTQCNPRVVSVSAGTHPNAASLGFYKDGDGQTYPIFPTTLPSVGFVMGIKEPFSTSIWIPLAFSPSIGVPPGTNSLNLNYRVKFVTTGKRLSSGRGSYLLFPYSLSAAGPLGSGGVVTPVSQLNTRLAPGALTLNVRARGCRVTQGETQTVVLPKVYSHKFKGVGTENDVAQPFTLTLQCDSRVTVFAGMGDALNPSNRGNILSTSGSASGVGVRLYREAGGTDAVLALGEDTSSPGTFAHRWRVGITSNAVATTFPVNLKAKYVQTAQNIRPGNLVAKAVITFSYQ